VRNIDKNMDKKSKIWMKYGNMDKNSKYGKIWKIWI
jgi:hypothetical protein